MGCKQGLKQEEDGQEAMDEDVDPPSDIHPGTDADVAQPLPGIFDDVKVEPDLKEEDDPGDIEVMLGMCPTLVAVPVGAGDTGICLLFGFWWVAMLLNVPAGPYAISGDRPSFVCRSYFAAEEGSVHSDLDWCSQRQRSISWPTVGTASNRGGFFTQR